MCKSLLVKLVALVQSWGCDPDSPRWCSPLPPIFLVSRARGRGMLACDDTVRGAQCALHTHHRLNNME